MDDTIAVSREDLRQVLQGSRWKGLQSDFDNPSEELLEYIVAFSRLEQAVTPAPEAPR